MEGANEQRLARRAVEDIGDRPGLAWIEVDRARESRREKRGSFPDSQSAVSAALAELEQQSLPRPDAIGHRLVHGGPRHLVPERITTELLADLRQSTPFAPLHLPIELETIEAVGSKFAGATQVACFDTGFHRDLPEIARRLPLPQLLWDQGLWRYGFHGISYEYIMQRLGPRAPSRIVIAHLGNGASMAAIGDRQPIDTTMGFKPSGGLMMGTRSGDLDPGVLLFLANEKRYDGARLDHLINNESGLLGVSGVSADSRTLLDQRATNRRAALAIEMFCYQIRKQIGAYAAALGGLEMLVFSGGIGEHAAPVRAGACRGLEHLGIRIDTASNDSNAEVISSGSCEVRIVPTDEELMIARHTRAVVNSG